jgi:hypothetical protein
MMTIKQWERRCQHAFDTGDVAEYARLVGLFSNGQRVDRKAREIAAVRASLKRRPSLFGWLNA